jgi:hypothetical protein
VAKVCDEDVLCCDERIGINCDSKNFKKDADWYVESYLKPKINELTCCITP